MSAGMTAPIGRPARRRPRSTGSSSAGSRLPVAGSQSTKYGVAPVYTTALAVAANGQRRHDYHLAAA